MSQSQEAREKMAARIAEMADTVFGVPWDEFALRTADDCAQMLQILSGAPVESTAEPFLPPLGNLKADEGAK